MKQDFTSMSLADRMAQGRDVGESYIRRRLAEKHGIKIEPARGYHADAKLKIDGYLNGEPVQIKLRRSGRDDRNDIAYELVRNHERYTPIRQQLQDIHQQGRDYKGSTIKHYFVMNREETAVYYIPADKIRKAVEVALDELEMESNGILDRPFTSATSGVQLRPTVDRDPQSFTPTKVMAFIPVEAVAGKTYDITESPDEQQGPTTTAGAQQVAVQKPEPTPAPAPQPAKPYVPPMPRKILNLNQPRRRPGGTT